MFDYLCDLYATLRERYTHGMTTALGVGWAVQAADVAGRVLGLIAIVVGIIGSLDKLRRDRQIHAMWMRQAAERSAAGPVPGSPRIFNP